MWSLLRVMPGTLLSAIFFSVLAAVPLAIMPLAMAAPSMPWADLVMADPLVAGPARRAGPACGPGSG